MGAVHWIPANELRVGDAVQLPDGNSSRALAQEETNEPFRRIDRLERSDESHVIPTARSQVAVWLEDGHFHRVPLDARVLVRRG